ncbi:MAG: hypothetical protein EWM50_02865 [Gottschalkiaceae bacterium]|nr:MAG: hypothetical protein EWM50_02865 [Gottschalkiaceae bacterium]
MIAIMTWKADLNEELKQRLDGSRVIDSVEELEDNIDYLDKVIISKHSEWSLEVLEELLLKLKDSGVEIIYITKAESAEEIKTCIDLGIEDFLIEPVTVAEIIRKIEFTGDTEIKSDNQLDIINDWDSFFEDKQRDYEEANREELLRLKALMESKEDQDNTDIKNNATDDKNEKAEKKKKKKPKVVENVQPVVTVKQESTFRFLLNWVYKIISLPVTLIGLIIEYMMPIIIMILISAVLTGVFFVLNKQGISTSEFMDEVFNLISDIIAKIKQ